MSRSELVDALWGPEPPPTARNIIQTRIKRLRQALEPGRRSYSPSGVLPTVGDGYALDASTIDLDLETFRRLVSEAAAARQRGDAGEEAALLARALRLWQGEPLADVPTLATHLTVTTLAEQRRTALVRYGEAALTAGALVDATAALEEAVARQPLDEAAVALLVRAYRAAGQRARAFATYHETRRRLADDLGIDPGPDLAAAHAALLTDEPTAADVPAQLPIDPAAFVGRVDDLRRLDKHVRTDSAVVCVCGPAGVGKTTLVTHWAHRMTAHFPDGQLFTDLRGFDEHSADPGDVLRGFLEALRVRPARIPSTVDGRMNLYRGQLAGRRMLVVLDNARDAEHVRPLLPGSPGCLVLVTSRTQLTGLVAANDAYPLRLDLLPDAEARTLLERRLGTERIAGEPDAVAEIVERCAGLPLALAVVAARAATYPDFRLAEIAVELRSGLDGFASGDGATDLWTVFTSSYRALGPAEQRLFRLLSLHPGPSVTAPVAAALVDAPVAATRQHLAELTRTHLLTEHRPGRYTVHDLLRAFAEEIADDDRHAARRRMLAHYRATARAASVLIDPHRSPVGLGTGPDPEPVDALTDLEQAMAWFAAERSALLAVIAAAERAGLPEDVYELAQSLAVFLQRRGHYQDLADTQHAALRAAREIGGPAVLARSHRGIATAYFRLCRYDESETHLQHALDLSRETGDAKGTAYTHLAFSTLFQAQDGRDDPALGHVRRALDLFREIDDATGQARALNLIGWLHVRLGDHDAAIAACEQALARLEELGDRHGQGMTWDSIGYAHHRAGDLGRAVDCYRRALDLLDDAGDRYIGAESLNRLGDCHAAMGDLGAALDAWRRAVTVLDDLGHPSADAVRAKLPNPELPPA